jgi:hypothetical protein
MLFPEIVKSCNFLQFDVEILSAERARGTKDFVQSHLSGERVMFTRRSQYAIQATGRVISGI